MKRTTITLHSHDKEELRQLGEHLGIKSIPNLIMFLKNYYKSSEMNKAANKSKAYEVIYEANKSK